MGDFDPLDFQPNSVGVLVVRVIRLKDVVRSLGCSEEDAREVIREIRGEQSADGRRLFVLPSQLAAWTYRQAGRELPPLPSTTVLVQNASSPRDGLRRAARQSPLSSDVDSAAPTLDAIRRELRGLKGTQVQPGVSSISVEQAAARLGCSRSQVFDELKSGTLERAPRVGRKTMVTVASVDGLQRGHPAQASRPEPRTRAQRQPTAADIKQSILKLTSRR